MALPPPCSSVQCRASPSVTLKRPRPEIAHPRDQHETVTHHEFCFLVAQGSFWACRVWENLSGVQGCRRAQVKEDLRAVHYRLGGRPQSEKRKAFFILDICIQSRLLLGFKCKFVRSILGSTPYDTHPPKGNPHLGKSPSPPQRSLPSGPQLPNQLKVDRSFQILISSTAGLLLRNLNPLAVIRKPCYLRYTVLW